MNFTDFIWVFIGGGSGASVRYLLSFLNEKFTGHIPIGTLTANLLGCLLIGFFSIIFINKVHIKPHHSLLVITGFLGGLTTFSTFGLETIHLLEKGHIAKAVIYVTLNLFIGLFLVIFARKMVS